MNPRWSKVGRDLVAHKVRTILVVLSVAVGIFAVAVMMGGRAVLIRALDSAFPQTDPASVTFIATPFDDHLVRLVERDPGVAVAQGLHMARLTFRVNGGDWKSITLYAYKDYRDIRVNKLDFAAGTKPPRRGEMLVEKGSAGFSGLDVGQDVEFETSGKKHPVLNISGTVHDLNVQVPMMTGAAVGFVSWDSLKDLEETEYYNDLDVKAARTLHTPAEVTELGVHLRDDVIEARSPVQVLRMVPHKPNTHYLADIFKAVSMLLVVVGVMTLCLSAFLVVNTIGALVTQQTRQIGVMKAVGARPPQLMSMYFSMVLAYGALGLLLAIPLGQLGSNWFVDFGASKLNYLVSDYGTPPDILSIELAVGLFVPLIAATVPVMLGMRMPVREALYNSGMNATEFGEGLFDRMLGRLKGLSRPIALALRNTFLRKGRLALTLITLTLAAAVFIAVASVRSSIFLTVDKIGAHRSMDLWADIAPAQPMAEAIRATKEVRGVTDAEGWIARQGIRIRPDRTESPPLQVDGVPPQTRFLHPELTSGRWLKTGDRNAIVVDTGFTKEDPDVQVGSVIKLKIRDFEEWFHVVGLLRGDFMNPYAYVNRDYLDKRIGAKGAVDTLMVSTAQHDAESQSEVARRVTDHLGEKQIHVSDTMTQRDLQKTIADSLSIIVVFLVIMAALLAAVGGIGLSGTMSINVLESTREIGVMRAIGAANMSIYQVFITEGIVVGLLSWLFGVIASVPISWLLTKALEAAMGFPLSFAFSPEGVLAWLAFVIVISVLASLLPAYRAARVSVAEAIAYE